MSLHQWNPAHLALQMLLILACILGFSPSAHAKRNIYAVLIGIDHYKQSARLPRLQYAVKDVLGIKKVLIKMGQVPSSHVKVLVNEQATRRKIITALNDWLRRKLRKNLGRATAIIYFSGHGKASKSEKHSYWLPYDIDISSTAGLLDQGFDQNQLRGYFRKFRKHNVIIFTDACQSGYTPSTSPSAGISGRKNVPMEIDGNLVTISSSRQSQLSWEVDKLQHSIFSYVLIQALRGHADTNKDGVVTLLEVWPYLRDNVPQLAQHYKQQQQDPRLTGSFSRPVSLSFPRGVVKKQNFQIDSQPQGAMILVNGTKQGRTPKSLSLTAGVYNITLQKTGYHTIQRSFLIMNRATLPWKPTLVQKQTSSTASIWGYTLGSIFLATGVAFGAGALTETIVPWNTFHDPSQSCLPEYSCQKRYEQSRTLWWPLSGVIAGLGIAAIITTGVLSRRRKNKPMNTTFLPGTNTSVTIFSE